MDQARAVRDARVAHSSLWSLRSTHGSHCPPADPSQVSQSVSPQDGSLSTIQGPTSSGTLNFPSNTSSIFCIFLNQDPHTRAGLLSQDLPHENPAQRSNCALTPRRINSAVPGAKQECPAHAEGAMAPVGPQRNPVLQGLLSARHGLHWTAEFLGHLGCCRAWDLGAWARGDFMWPWHGEVWGALTSWHSRTRLVSSPARTGDAPRRILQTAL